MKKSLPVIVLVVIIALVVGGIYLVKSQFETPVPPPAPAEESAMVAKKVDLSTQPEWVQKLVVTVKKGISANGLNNFTFTISGMPKGMVKSLTYVASYDTSNKGSQGVLATKPLEVGGATSFIKTIDLGTCSTKSCVRHDGVKSVDLELDFTTTSGDRPMWSKNLTL